LNTKDTSQKCALIMLADGFDEVEAIVILSVLRRAGVYAKSVGLIGGIISGSHGILVKPDFTLADLDRSVDVASINMVVLPGGERNFSSLEADPRIHRLLRQILAQNGSAVTNTQGMRMLNTVIGQNNDSASHKQKQITLWHPLEQSIEAFAQDLTRGLEQTFD